MKFKKLITGTLLACTVLTASPIVTQNAMVVSEAAAKKKNNIGNLSFAIADPDRTINAVHDTGEFTAMHIVEVNAVFVPKNQKTKHKYTLYEITGGKKNKIIDLKYRSNEKSLKMGIGDGTMFSYTRKFGIRCPFQNSDKFQKFIVMDEKGRRSKVCEHATLLDIGDHDESVTTTVYLKNKKGKWIKQRSYKNTWIDTVKRDKDYTEEGKSRTKTSKTVKTSGKKKIKTKTSRKPVAIKRARKSTKNSKRTSAAKKPVRRVSKKRTVIIR